MVSIPFKRGDTFLVQGTVSQDSVAQDISGWAVRSQVRDGSTLVSELVVAITSAADGTYTLTKSDTTAWPVKTLSCDIQYTTASGQIVSTETFQIVVQADITLDVVV